MVCVGRQKDGAKDHRCAFFSMLYKRQGYETSQQI